MCWSVVSCVGLSGEHRGVISYFFLKVLVFVLSVVFRFFRFFFFVCVFRLWFQLLRFYLTNFVKNCKN